MKAWVFAVPAVLVVGLLAWSAWPHSGEEVLLATRAVDPPDPLRGDYVELDHEVAVLDARGLRQGDTVYVALAPGARTEPGTGDPYWEVQGWGHARSDLPDGVCMKGRVAHASGHQATVRYGIENYFIQKDETMEDWRGKEVSVVVKARDCTARIVEVHLDGKKWDG